MRDESKMLIPYDPHKPLSVQLPKGESYIEDDIYIYCSKSSPTLKAVIYYGYFNTKWLTTLIVNITWVNRTIALLHTSSTEEVFKMIRAINWPVISMARHPNRTTPTTSIWHALGCVRGVSIAL